LIRDTQSPRNSILWNEEMGQLLTEMSKIEHQGDVLTMLQRCPIVRM
jgi:hypothetical protein